MLLMEYLLNWDIRIPALFMYLLFLSVPMKDTSSLGSQLLPLPETHFVVTQFCASVCRMIVPSRCCSCWRWDCTESCTCTRSLCNRSSRRPYDSVDSSYVPFKPGNHAVGQPNHHVYQRGHLRPRIELLPPRVKLRRLRIASC